MAGVSGKKLDDTYKLAWQRGLKTTYYLRTLSASAAEKSTGQGGELNSVSSGGTMNTASAIGAVPSAAMPHAGGSAIMVPPPLNSDIAGPVCMLKPGDGGFEDCEACQ